MNIFYRITVSTETTRTLDEQWKNYHFFTNAAFIKVQDDQKCLVKKKLIYI